MSSLRGVHGDQPQSHEAQLSIKERLNFPYLLANQVLTFQKSLLAEEFSEREIKESIKGFVNLIPSTWEDDEYKTAIKDASRIKEIDIRPIVAGNLRMRKDVCQQLGIPHAKIEESFDYYKMFKAVIDLLDRRKLLTRIEYVEKLENIDYDTAEASTLWKSNLLDRQE